MAGAGPGLTGGASPTPPTFLKGAARASRERRATAEKVRIEGADMIEEAVSIAGALKKGESGHLAAGRRESAAAARTAATSRSTKKSLSHARSLRSLEPQRKQELGHGLSQSRSRCCGGSSKVLDKPFGFNTFDLAQGLRQGHDQGRMARLA